ncbi:fimbrial protein [Enterobacter soli]|uniref:fimbrial protein n=1 Tax=Enterobacter soli TaxID=885040 RepID=UPI0034CD7EE3
MEIKIAALNKKRLLVSTSLVAVLLTAAGAVRAAENIDLTFSANIRETTCDIKIDGGTGDGTNNTLSIGANGNTRVDTIATGAAKENFKLVITECPSSLNALKTSVSGTVSESLTTAIANSVGTEAGGAANIGLSIARASAPDAPFVINSTDDSKRLVWTRDEITAKEVGLVATLVETAADQAATGSFRAIATFNFSYE